MLNASCAEFAEIAEAEDAWRIAPLILSTPLFPHVWEKSVWEKSVWEKAQEKGAALAKAILDVFRRRKPNFGLDARKDREEFTQLPWLKEMETYWSAPVDRE